MDIFREMKKEATRISYWHCEDCKRDMPAELSGDGQVTCLRCGDVVEL